MISDLHLKREKTGSDNPITLEGYSYLSEFFFHLYWIFSVMYYLIMRSLILLEISVNTLGTPTHVIISVDLVV